MGRRVAAVAALMLVLGAAACGDDSEADGSASADSSSAPGGFPVTVEHEFGTTGIAAPPERIVTIGYTEQDTVLALGETPVGVTEWYGDFPFATWPWASDELGDAEPEVLSVTDGFEYERIAALDPDLIIGTNAGLDADSYEQMSAIAPTIAQPEGAESYFSSWRPQTLLIGAALGQLDEAEALIAEVDAQFAAAAADHPEFEGTQAIFLQNAFYDGEAIAYQEGLSSDFLTDLGFAIPAELDPFVREAAGSQAFIPLEQLAVLDVADVLVWGTESPDDRVALEQEPLYRNLEEVRDRRLVFTGGLLAGAIYFTSPLSLPFVIETLVPALASTLAGDGPVELERDSR